IGDVPEPRWSCGVLFQIAARDAAAIDGGRYRLVLDALFTGAGLALARFAPLPRDDVVAQLRRPWAFRQREGGLGPAGTHHHRSRTANAGLRPSLFGHEIELPGEKASPGATVIPLRDLVMRYDSGHRRLRLSRKSDGVEVIPVISSGVNPEGVVSALVAVGLQ